MIKRVIHSYILLNKAGDWISCYGSWKIRTPYARS